MDVEDKLYLTAAVLIGVGAGTYSIGAGLIAFGLMLAFGPVLSMLRSGRGDKSK